jgi:lactoylglutathione lyase
MNLSTYLIVKDMDASRSFYKALFQSESDGWCPGRFESFSVGNALLALYNPHYDEHLVATSDDISKHFNQAYLDGMKMPTTYGNNFVLNITVDDLAQEYERIKALNIGNVSEIKYVNVAAPYWYFNLTDPDENCIEIAGGYNP